MEKFNFTKKIVLEAGEIIRLKLIEPLDVSTKSSKHDFVTNLDKDVERFLVNKISTMYDKQSFLTEEKTVNSTLGESLWVIDPIDGTMNLVKQNKNFAISIAYYENKKPQFGIVYDVINNIMYSSEAGKGAFINSKKLEKLRILSNVSDMLFNASAKTIQSFTTNPIPLTMGQRYIGSASLEICEVAIGASNAYISNRLNYWDIGAAIIILNEVGGCWDYNASINSFSLSTQQAPFIAASDKRVLKVVKSWK